MLKLAEGRTLYSLTLSETDDSDGVMAWLDSGSATYGGSGDALLYVPAADSAPLSASARDTVVSLQAADAHTSAARADIAAPLPTFTINQIADYLKQGYWDDQSTTYHSFNMGSTGTGANNGVLYYDYDGYAGTIGGFADADGLTAARRVIADNALEYIGEILGITFIHDSSPPAGGVDLYFRDADTGGAYENEVQYATGNGSANHRYIDYAYVNIPASWFGSSNAANDYTAQTFVHEIGHALGLGHGGDYNGSANYVTDTTDPDYGNNSNVYLNDSWQQTTMSYFDQNENTSIPAATSYAFLLTYMAGDFEALRDYYGSSAFTGNTIYGFNTNISAVTNTVLANLSSYADDNAFSIIDDGGTDTVDFSGFSNTQRIDISIASGSSTTGTISNIGGLTGNMTLAVGTVIENAIGGSGADTIIGNTANNVLTGNAGNDAIFGDSLSDTLSGGAGNDVLEGGLDDDTLNGGTENDTLYANRASSIDGSTVGDTLNGNAGDDTIWGSGGSDDITGGADNDTVDARAGNDTITDTDGMGSADDDVYNGGAGIDTLIHDLTWSSSVAFNLTTGFSTFGGNRDQLISIENLTVGGSASVTGSSADNVLIVNGTGANIIDGEGGNDTINAGGGNDTVDGGTGNDTINGGADNDTLTASSGVDALFGDAGDDTLWPGVGGIVAGESFNGGAGIDTLDFSNYGGDYVVNLTTGVFDAIGGGSASTVSSIENVNAGSGDDTLTGNGSSNVLNGGSGNDTIAGAGGVDTIDGGAGNDVITDGNAGIGDSFDGGTGVDTLIANFTWADAVLYDLVSGWMRFPGSGGTTYDTILNFENLTTAGGADVIGTAGANIITILATGGINTNTITAGGGNDTVSTGIGNDTIDGGTGEDAINAGSGNDSVNAGDGNDTITDTEAMGASDDDVYDGGAGIDTLVHDLGWINTVSFNLTTGFATYLGNRDQLINIENLTVGGSASVIGSAGDNVLTVNGTGDNVIDGMGGNDTINAGGGNDTVDGGTGDDTINGGADNDALTAGSGVDSLFGDAGDDTLLPGLGGLSAGESFSGGSGIDTLDFSTYGFDYVVNLTTGVFDLMAGGSASTLSSIENVDAGLGDDTLTGSAGSNVLNGGGGNDTINGGGGVDTINGGSGDDVITDAFSGIGDSFDGGSGIDTLIADFTWNDAVQYDLASGWMRFPGSGGTTYDTILNIENLTTAGGADVIGSAAANVITILETGATHTNTISAGAGNDTVSTGSGNDTIDGGTGDDAINAGSGNDTVNAGDGNDTITDTEAMTAGAEDDIYDGGAGIDTLIHDLGWASSVAFNLNTGFVTVSGGNRDQLINIENLTVGGAASLTGSNGDNVLTVNGTGDNVIDGLGGNDTISSGGGNDTLDGGSGADTFRFAPADLNSFDTVVGGSGAVNDVLTFTAAGTVTTAMLANVSGIENVNLFSGGNTVSLTNAMVASANGGVMRVFGGAGNDTVNAAAVNGAGLSVTFSTGGGNDTLTGSAGVDTFVFAVADFNASDVVNGALGSDALAFTTNGAVTAAMLAGVQSVELIRFLGGGVNSLTLNAAFMNTVTGGVLGVNGGAGNDTIDGSALTSSAHRLSVVTGAGNDTVLGGLGADQVFFTGADFNGSDVYTAGTGAVNDTLGFTTVASVAAAAFAGVSQVEIIQLMAAGANSLQLSNALVTSARNSLLDVRGNAGNDTINGALVTSATNRLLITAGAGTDTLTGGAGSDFFQFNVADLTGADTVIGGGGAANDTLIFLSAGTVAAGAFAGVSGIETVRLYTIGNNTVTLTDALVGTALNTTLTVLGYGGNDTVDASGVTSAGRRVFFSTGAGSDTLTGGAGNDTFTFLTGDLTGDTVVGGGGADVLAFSNGGTITAANLANVSGVETVTLANGTNTLSVPDAMVTSVAGSLTINGGTLNDTVNATALTGANRVIVIANGGNDTLSGGAGPDQFRFAVADYNASDTVDGNGGNDLLYFTTAGTVAAAAFAGTSEVESILLTNGTNNITLSNAMVGSAASALVTVTGGTGNDTINGASVTTAANRVTLNGGDGDDTLTGGAGNDILNGAVGLDIIRGRAGLDTLTGGTGNDDFVYGASGDSNETAGLDTIADMDAGDQLDFSALLLATSTSAILNRGNAAYLGTTANFFDDSGTDRAVAVQTNGVTTRAYADSNGDGNYTLGVDLAVQFTGNVLANLTSTSDFIF